MNAKKRGVSSLQSWVRMGIFAMRPVGDRRPPILANTKEGYISGDGGGRSFVGWGASPSLGRWRAIGSRVVGDVTGIWVVGGVV